MKIYLIQSKNGIMINVNVNVRNQLIGVLVKETTCEILAHVIVNVIKREELVSILILIVLHAKNVF